MMWAGVPSGSVLARKSKGSRLAVDSEGGNGVGALVAGVEEVPRRINVEAARVVAASPLLAAEGQHARRADGKPRDGIVQPVGSVEEFAACGNHDLRSIIRAHKALGQAGYCLFLGQPSARRVIVVGNQRRGLFLE